MTPEEQRRILAERALSFSGQIARPEGEELYDANYVDEQNRQAAAYRYGGAEKPSYLTPDEWAANNKSELIRASFQNAKEDGLSTTQRKNLANYAGDAQFDMNKVGVDLLANQQTYRRVFDPINAESTDAYRGMVDTGRNMAAQGQQGIGTALGSYADVLSGKTPSLAEQQVTDAAGEMADAGMAVATSGRGNPALAIRNAQNQSVLGQQKAAADAGQVRLSEQAQARQGLAAASASAFGQGSGVQSSAQDSIAAGMRDERNFITGRTDLDEQQAREDKQMKNQMIMQGAGAALGAGGMAMASDKRVKEDMQDPSSDLNELLHALEGTKDYEYKDDSGFDDGERHVSPMAQDLARTALGKALVEEDTDGTLLVDYGKQGPLVLGALGILNKRLRALEGNK